MTDPIPQQQAKLAAATRRFRDTACRHLAPAVREAVAARPPFFLYRIRSTGVRGLMLRVGVADDGRATFTLACLPSLNPGWDSPTGQQAFGLSAADIEPVEVYWDAVGDYLGDQPEDRAG